MTPDPPAYEIYGRAYQCRIAVLSSNLRFTVSVFALHQVLTFYRSLFGIQNPE